MNASNCVLGAKQPHQIRYAVLKLKMVQLHCDAVLKHGWCHTHIDATLRHIVTPGDAGMTVGAVVLAGASLKVGGAACSRRPIGIPGAGPDTVLPPTLPTNCPGTTGSGVGECTTNFSWISDRNVSTAGWAARPADEQDVQVTHAKIFTIQVMHPAICIYRHLCRCLASHMHPAAKPAA